MYKRILFPTSGSPISEKKAKTIAHLIDESPNSEITILYVLEVTPFHRSVSYQLEDKGIDPSKLALEEAKEVMSKATKIFKENNIPFKIRVEMGEPVETILRVAKEMESDLLVVGHHGESTLSDYLFKGNITSELINKANFPILVIK
ncbi:MAG: universal stress protein [Bacillota bacterium]